MHVGKLVKLLQKTHYNLLQNSLQKTNYKKICSAAL